MSERQQDDWRARALRNIELAEQMPAETPQLGSQWDAQRITVLAAKCFALVLLAGVLYLIVGWGWVPAVALAAWLLFYR